jgi:hypothetical protein
MVQAYTGDGHIVHVTCGPQQQITLPSNQIAWEDNQSAVDAGSLKDLAGTAALRLIRKAR